MLSLKKFFYLKLEYEKKVETQFLSGRPYWVLDYYKNKMILLDADQNETEAGPDSVFLIPPGVPTMQRSADGAPWICTTATFDADGKFMDSFGIPYMRPVHITDTHEIDDLTFMLESSQLSSSDMKQRSADAYLTLILISVHNSIGTVSKELEIKEGDDLRRVRHTVMSSTHIPWTLELMAAQANMSVSSFQRKYKKMYGKSPIADLYDYRFLRAKRLLKDGYSIEHTVYSCGLGSPQHFSAFFRSRAGMTPTRYREKFGK